MIRLFFALAVICPMLCFGQSLQNPPEGTLLIIGGGRLDTVFYKTFMEAAGGSQAPVVVIPTAGGDDPEARDPGFKRLRENFEKQGFKNVTVLHTTSREEADSDAFCHKIFKANGVWFTGGRQWRLMDVYYGTKAYDAFFEVLKNGGVVSGSSAGATIQGSYLARGDTNTNTIMMGDHEEGFSFLTNVAIDQHVIRRNRQFDVIEILDAHPELLGIGLDENTGILVRDNQFEVIGSSYILVHDRTFWHAPSNSFKRSQPGEKKFHFMKAGDKYDLEKWKRIE